MRGDDGLMNRVVVYTGFDLIKMLHDTDYLLNNITPLFLIVQYKGTWGLTEAYRESCSRLNKAFVPLPQWLCAVCAQLIMWFCAGC